MDPSYFTSGQWYTDLSQFLMSPLGNAIGTGACIGGLGGVVTNAIQQHRADVFPVLFSNVNSISRDASDEAVYFCAAANDVSMYVTQSWNARKRREFFSELRNSRINSSISSVQREGSGLLAKLQTHQDVAKQTTQAARLLHDSWEYDKTENYRTEIYFETNSKGQSEMKTRQVYSDTDHYFTFHKEQALQAQTILKELAAYHDLYVPNFNITVSGTPADKKLIQETILESKKEVSDDDLSKYMNQWLFNVIGNSIIAANKNFNALTKAATPDTFDWINQSKEKYHYNTSSRSHPGPEGYRRTVQLENYCEEVIGNIERAVSSINTVQKNATSIGEILNKQLIGASLEAQSKKERRKLMNKTLDLAVASYTELFPASTIDMDQRVSGGVTAFVVGGSGIAAGLLMYYLNT